MAATKGDYLGIPVKVLKIAEGQDVVIESNAGEIYKGRLLEVEEENMSCQLIDVEVTACNGIKKRLEVAYLRGRNIRIIVLPENLKQGALFLRNQAQARGGGRGRGRAQRGRGRSGGHFQSGRGSSRGHSFTPAQASTSTEMAYNHPQYSYIPSGVPYGSAYGPAPTGYGPPIQGNYPPYGSGYGGQQY